MLLAFDVGNSNIKVGLLQPHDLVIRAKIRISSQLERTADEYALFIENFLNQHNLGWENLCGVIVSSVVPVISKELSICLQKVAPDHFFLGPGIKTGLRIGTQHPQELGTDLVANAAAAYRLCQKACIAVAFGTATTLTCVSDSGELLGVAIAPGIEAALSSLVKNTALLHQVRLDIPSSAIGRNTQEAIRAGLILGSFGSVTQLILLQVAEMLKQNYCQSTPEIYVTGYFGKFYQKQSTTSTTSTTNTMSTTNTTSITAHYKEDLLLYGLGSIWQKNQA